MFALLDTDTLSEILKQRNQTVTARALAYISQSGPLTYSAITRYEVLRGYKQLNATTQLSRFAVFSQRALILPVTNRVFDRASDLWAHARMNGHPHHDADLIIAATALESGRVLVTGNTRHFQWIPGLQLEDWRTP